MPDMTNDVLQRLTTHRLEALDLKIQAVHPVYEGLSLLNVPTSLCRWLGAPDLAHPPLDVPELDKLTEGVKQIVVTLIDAVSYERFRRWINGAAPELNPEAENCLLVPLTSVVPSTTSAVLTTLWTGRSPAEHGILGYELFLKEYGLVANMISHTPMTFEDSTGLLYRAGFQPETALPFPTLGSHLESAEIETNAFLHYTISRSGLSRMHYSNVNLYTFGSVPGLWIGVRKLVEKDIERSRLIWVYYGAVDGLSHRHGPDSEQAQAEFTSFIHAMSENFVSRLSHETRRQTILLLVADHGQITTPPDSNFDLRNHHTLTNRLHLLPTGENRLAYLYPRPGQTDAVVEYFEKTWPNAFTLLPSEHALEAGLFGPGKPASTAGGRLGDLIAISRGDAYLWWAAKENPLLGRHGGLSADEMLVPLLAARLG